MLDVHDFAGDVFADDPQGARTGRGEKVLRIQYSESDEASGWGMADGGWRTEGKEQQTEDGVERMRCE
jgi:hypothetical protein